MDKNMMFKNVMIIVLIFALVILVCVTYSFYEKNIEYKTKSEEEVRIYKEENIKKEVQDALKKSDEEEKSKFLENNVYDNKIPIGLYTKQNGKLVLTKEIYCNWSMESVFSIFYAVASNDETLTYTNFGNLFKEYWNKNENIDGYKIGYNIKFYLDDGTEVNKNVINPEIAESLFSKLQFYLYDDVTYMPNRNYYHMRQYEMTDATLLTSVKIVGDKETPGVNGPIELTVFTYNGDEDFDKETGKYLGNSKFTTKIYREKE